MMLRQKLPYRIICLPAMIALVSLTAVNSVAAAANSPSQRFAAETPTLVAHWRTPRASGICSLFVALRLEGFPGTPEDFFATASARHFPNDLSGLSELARHFGYAMRPVRLTREELLSQKGPLVVFVETAGVGSGAYWVYLGSGARYVHVFGGPRATWIEVEQEPFFRAWTGYALIRERPTVSYQAVAAGLGIGLLGLGLFHLLLFYARRGLRHHMRVGHPPAIIGIVAIALFGGRAKGALSDVQLPQDARLHLDQNAQSLSPISVEWTEQSVPLRPEKELVGQLHVWPGIFSPMLFRIRWDDGRIYMYSRIQEGEDHEFSYDGSIFYRGRPLKHGQLNPELIKTRVSIAKSAPPGKLIRTTYFEMAGYSLPDTYDGFLAGRAQSRIARLLAEGSATVSVAETKVNQGRVLRIVIDSINAKKGNAQGEDLAKLEHTLKLSHQSAQDISKALRDVEARRSLPATKRLIFDLDPARNYAVVGEQERFGDHLISKTRCEDFVQIPGRSVWLPRFIATDSFSVDTQPGSYYSDPVLRKEYRVTSLSGDEVPEEAFVLDYTRGGTEIIDHTTAGKFRSYVVPASPAELDSAIQEAGKPGIRSIRWPTILLLNVVAACAAALAWSTRWIRGRLKRNAKQ